MAPEIVGFRGRLLALAGPTCTGKTTILRHLTLTREFALLPPMTTRPPRSGEESENRYHFVTASAFQLHIRQGDLLFWDHLFGHYYGIPASLHKCLDSNSRVAVTVPVWRLRDLHSIQDRIISIHFLAPPTDELEQRIRAKRMVTPDELAARLKDAAQQNQMSIPGTIQIPPISLSEVQSAVDSLIDDWR